MKKLIGAKEVATKLSISLRKLEQMVANGELPGYFKLGRIRKWDLAAIDEWIERRVAHSPDS
ncbi:MAG: helix-turn-helix domain-containing protein [Betaproteobacteria bacterium]|nr:helix-turn-helix domain-containing protein [Betaproteobacteria bacterium]